MKKLVLTIAIIFGMAFGASAQIFLIDADNSNRLGEDISGFNIDNPGYGQGTDFYAPVGSGMLLLAGLAGAYLLDRKRKE